MQGASVINLHKFTSNNPKVIISIDFNCRKNCQPLSDKEKDTFKEFGFNLRFIKTKVFRTVRTAQCSGCHVLFVDTSAETLKTHRQVVSKCWGHQDNHYILNLLFRLECKLDHAIDDIGARDINADAEIAAKLVRPKHELAFYHQMGFISAIVERHGKFQRDIQCLTCGQFLRYPPKSNIIGHR